MIYKGGCHCGKINFTIDSDIQNVMQCNCSICTKRGYLLSFLPRTSLHLTTLESNMSTYTFNKHQIKHRFYPTCGCAPFGEAINPKTGEASVAINVRCLENVDISKLEIKFFDGRSI